MAKNSNKKNKKEFRFGKHMKKKLAVVFLLVFLLLLGLIVRIIYIQETKGDKYEKIVLSQQGYNSETIPYKRGDILDSKGNILATSEDVYNVIVDCKVINTKTSYKEPTIQALLACFPDVTREELETILTERPNSQYYVLRKKLPFDEISDFVKMQEEVYTEGRNKGDLVNPNIKGIWFEKEYIRNYPYNSLASKVLGFTTSGNVGIGGLEDYYNSMLNGTNGRKYGYLNSENDVERTIIDAIDGNTLVTTLNLNVQNVVEQKIAKFNEEHWDEFRQGPGATNIGVLVMNPQNGEIIAMADSTSYNLNDPWNEEALAQYCMNYKNYSEEDAYNLDEETRLDMLNAMWQNFCITYTYEPGSTAKPLTVATALEVGAIKPTDGFDCDGGEWIGGDWIKCVNRDGHGWQNLSQTIMNSCNDALMQISWRIGISNFAKYQNIFNIGLKTNIDLPGEARTDTLIQTEEDMRLYASAMPTNAFGQNFNLTTIQLASAIASTINGGYYYQPHFVKKIVDENGQTVQSMEPTVLKQTISKETSDKVKSYMVDTVEIGTGKSAKVEGYSMGGKTGTAEKYPRGNGNYVVSFIGFAPTENPEVLVYVVINEPNVEEQANSRLATTLSKEIMEEIFPYLDIYPDQPVSDTTE